MGKAHGDLTKIPIGLQWLNGKVDTWPTAGRDTSKEGRLAAIKAANVAQQATRTNSSSSNPSSYYGPGQQNKNSGGRNGKGRGGGRHGGRNSGRGKYPCLSCLCEEAQTLHTILNKAYNSNEHTIPVCITQEGVEIRLEALIDTGALQGNYISHQKADRFCT